MLTGRCLPSACIAPLSDSVTYIGRFAPSPTGLLHFGSLLAALAGYLDARAHQGRWLLRIEDLDPPREHPDARLQIPQTLADFGLHWDGDILFQSDRLSHYQAALDQLYQQQRAYRCDCSRKQIQQRSGSTAYDGHCRQQPPASTTASAWRSITRGINTAFDDGIQGPQRCCLDDGGDFVIKRKDGLFAYQLAVVVDDAFQQISHIVRGCDLLEETHRQRHLQQQLGFRHPHYSHIPVASNATGQKLSKQNLAQPLDSSRPVPQLIEALRFLGQQPPPELQHASLDELLHWATTHWQQACVPRQPAIIWEP